MKKKVFYIFALFVSFLVAAACTREIEPVKSERPRLPDGTPVTIGIPFLTTESTNIQIRTKVEALAEDESRVHDLYVLIFDSEGNKFYGRYFTHEHMSTTLSALGGNSNEGWYVDDNTLHKGVVKISTEAQTGCTLVVIANLVNTVTSLDGEDPVDRLTDITTLTQFKDVKVNLEQHVLNRDDLFLMLGYLEGLSTSDMVWYTSPGPDYDTPNYNSDYRVALNRIDAKVKFRIKYNTTNISGVEPRYWQVYNVPSSCYLFPSDEDPTGEDRLYFNSDEVYFETEEVEDGDKYQVFTFYMLENRQLMKKTAGDNYYNRDKQIKTPVEEGSTSVTNGDWEYAPDNGTYVKFDMVLTLTSAGIEAMVGSDEGLALTTDAIFTVHLGDFGSTTSGSYDDYNILRNHAYTYNITLNNSKSIYIEVTDEDRTREPEAGQEGSLLFAKDTIILCDAHYSYYTLTFKRDETLRSNKSKISWNVKTPFCEGGAKWSDDAQTWVIDSGVIDYEWIKFAVNSVEDGKYVSVRQGYPGESSYDASWYPGKDGDMPSLMNIQQLILYIFSETDKTESESDFKNGVIKLTAFVDEYYYEKDPRTGSFNANLWREFVNAQSREMHILSQASISADGQSDIVNASHSIIQRSIQTIYNTSSPYLTSIWGTEHTDEMRNRGEKEEGYTVHCGWPWSTDKAQLVDDDSYCNDKNNGRYNTAGLWGVNPDGGQSWSKFMKYAVQNSVPELRDGTDGGDNSTNYQLMAYSCLTRNRDNDGNGVIDEDEVRWYLASLNQVIGIWVGTESLSPTARIYQPHDATSTNPYEWRSHVVTSTCNDKGSNPIVIAAEEGTSIYNYYSQGGYGNTSWNVFATTADAGKATYAEKEWNKIQSVRCVRNAGAFSDNGIKKDITYAPLTVQPDQYYDSSTGFDESGTLLANNDGTYTLRFDNLSTKSIREYTSIDLPYHNEYSYHNRVYLELNMQSPDDDVYGLCTYTLAQINDTITLKGYNPYCPSGYRLPNMTELAVMRALLPSSYWYNSGDNGKTRPSRTFFSKGSRGSSYPTESNKLGWAYSTTSGFLYLPNLTDAMQGFRCVRDLNMTGDISGKLQLANNRLHVGDDAEISFNFTSTASPIVDASLALCYIDSDGNDKELSISIEDMELNSMTLLKTMTYTIPSDLPASGVMYFKATIKNSIGTVESFTVPFKLVSDIDASISLLPYQYSEAGDNLSFPVLVNAFSENGASISSWKLWVITPDATISSFTMDPCSSSSWSMVYDYAFDSYSALQQGTYTFYISVVDSDGNTIRSNEVSMDILLNDMQPDGEKWEIKINGGIDVGDFIEAKMDVTESNSNSYVRENLISIGTKIDGTYNNTVAFHLYYPDASGNNKMRFNPVNGNGTIMSCVPYLTPDGTTSTTPSDKMLVMMMDSNGLFWNNLDYWDYTESTDETQRATCYEKYSSLLEYLCSSNTLLIGSQEGNNRSHADYKYIRFVHNSSVSENNVHWEGNFENDPVDGGEL